MELFRQTPFLAEAFGMTLLNSLWTGILLWGVVKFMLHLVNEDKPSLRYSISLAGLLVYAGSFAALFFAVYSPAGGRSAPIPGEFLQIPPGSFSVTGTGHASIFSRINLIYFSLFGYLTGLVYMLFRTLISLGGIVRLRNSGAPAGKASKGLLDRLRIQLGITRRVRLVISPGVEGPGLAGLLRPVILVPTGLFTHMPFYQVESILLHELFHLRRLDPMVNFLQALLEVLFFYHPAVWGLSGIIRMERERCCDDMVIRHCRDPLDYVKALYSIAGGQGRKVVLAAGGSEPNELLKRIRRIMNVPSKNKKKMKPHIMQRLIPLVVVALAVVMLLTFSAFSSGLSFVKRDGSGMKIPEYTEIQKGTRQEAPRRSELYVRLDTVPPLSGKASSATASKNKAELEEEVVEQIKEMKEEWKSIDWDELREEMEEARKEALESVDWEELRVEMENARKEVMESVDWEKVSKEMEKAREMALDSIDWNGIKLEMKEIRIQLDSLKTDIDIDKDFDFDIDLDVQIDVDDLKADLQKSLEEIRNMDLDKIRADMEALKIHFDSLNQKEP